MTQEQDRQVNARAYISATPVQSFHVKPCTQLWSSV